jgi:hypothetical protein
MRTRRWLTRFEQVDRAHGFTEELLEGCVPSWSLTRKFREESPETSRLEEHVKYTHGMFFGRKLEDKIVQALDWRHRRTRQDLARHKEVGMPVRRVLVTGSSGLVGQALCCFLESGGHEVRRLVRRQPDSASGEFAWDPARGEIDLAAFEGVHAVVNLAGASLVEKRWTPERMELLQSSRVASTKLVAESMTRVGTSAALLNASATGYYGDRPEGEVCESDAPGTGFLARTCVAWERAADPAREAGVRVASLRIGVVVARAGGVVGKLRTPVLLGVAGPVGSGRQGMSWIALDDLLGVVLHAIENERYEGPINVVAPQAIDNRGFIRMMGRVLSRPTIAPLPAFVARALFGKMGEEALLQGSFAAPRRLEELGFRHDFPDLESALRFELGRLA